MRWEIIIALIFVLFLSGCFIDDNVKIKYNDKVLLELNPLDDKKIEQVKLLPFELKAQQETWLIIDESFVYTPTSKRNWKERNFIIAGNFLGGYVKRNGKAIETKKADNLSIDDGLNINLNLDKDYPLEIENINFTNNKLTVHLKNIGITDKDLNTDIPIKVIGKDKDGKVKEKLIKNENFKSVDDKSEVSVALNVGEVLKYGDHSTNITYTSNDSLYFNDTYVQANDVDKNFGGGPTINIEGVAVANLTSLLKIDVYALLGDITFTNTSLLLINQANLTTGIIIDIFEQTVNWKENTLVAVVGNANWDNSNDTTIGGWEGGYTTLGNILLNDYNFTGDVNTTFSVELDTTYTQNWIDNPLNNHGIELVWVEGTTDTKGFYSSEGLLPWKFYFEYTLRNVAPINPNPIVNSTTSDQQNYSNETLACNFLCNDSNIDDTLTYDIYWYKNGEYNIRFINEGCTNPSYNSPELNSGNTSTGELWMCSINVTDNGTVSSSTVFSNNLTILPLPNTNVTIYLDGETTSRKYEYDTTANITTRGDGDNTICIDLDDIDYGTNYTCGLPANITYLVGELTDQNISDLSEINLTLDKTNSTKFNLTNSSNYISFRFNVSGDILDGIYPRDIMCDFNNDSSSDFILTGELVNDVYHLDRFSNNLTEESILYTGAGVITRNFNISKVSGLIHLINGTMNISGTPSNPENITFNDLYHNTTHIDLDNSTVNNIFVWEDFSEGDILGRWTGTYTIISGTQISDAQTLSSTTLGSGSSGTNSFRSQTLAIENYGSVFVRVSLNANGCAQGTSADSAECSGLTNGGSASGQFRIRDKTTGSTTLIKQISHTANVGCGTTGTNSGGTSDTSIWEIRRVGSNFEFYDDGVYSSQMAFDSTHQYEVYIQNTASTENGLCSGCGACGSGIGAQGSANPYINWINVTGITGEKIGNFTWGNSSVTSKLIANFSSNINTAILTASENAPTGNSIDYYLSADNGTTWESVQNGITHVFNVTGQDLKYQINVTSTGVQDTDGDLSQQGIVYDINLQVVQGFASNLSLDVGNDGIIEWDYPFELNNNNSIVANFSTKSVLDYINNNPTDDLNILLPIGIRSNSTGGILINNIDYNMSIGQLNFDSFIDNLTTASIEEKLLMTCEAEQSGLMLINGFQAQYPGDGNFTVFAYDYLNNWVNDTRIIIARYSPFNFSYPQGIKGVRVGFTNNTQFNVTPKGQEVNYCNNNNLSLGFCDINSTGIYNFSTTARTDPVNITVKLNTSLASCLEIRSEDNVSGDIFPIYFNTSEQQVIGSIPINKSINQIWLYFNSNGCNSSTLRSATFNPIFSSYCESCVRNV